MVNLTVLKFGGSVLRDETDLATAVEEIGRWLERAGELWLWSRRLMGRRTGC